MKTTCRKCQEPMTVASEGGRQWVHVWTRSRWCGSWAELTDPDFELVEGSP